MTSQEILSEQRDLSFRFIQFFLRKGMVYLPEEPLIPREDQTVLFTNATIVPLKPFLLGKAVLPEFGVVLMQTCLRTQNLKLILDAKFRLEYLSLFSMLGVLVNASRGKEIFLDAIDYLINVEAIGAERILIRCSSNIASNQTFISTTEASSIAVEIDTRPPNYYRWVYGISGIFGSGLTFAILQKNGSYLDIGNLVEIRSADGILGFEFGFGVETFLARKLNLDSPASAAFIHQPIANGCIYDEKLRDCLASSLAMIRAGVKPGSGRQASILRKSLRCALLVANKLRLSSDQITAWLQGYVLASASNSYEDFLLAIDYLENYRLKMNVEDL